ncbi:MAG: excinuclease ABC subunit UvrC [Caldisericia bacterium]
MKWKKDLSKVPQKPGVYIFSNKEGEVIYVGKATSLRDRLSSYLSKSKVEFPKDTILRNKISTFDYIVTSSPEEALLLESNLIKKYKPKFNVRLKDDKSYPYLKIIMDEFPYIQITRKIKKDNSIYFGPFVDVKSLRKVVYLGRKIFKIRRCEKKLPNKKCIYYDLGECDAPCIKNISKENYLKKINDFILLIKNNYKKLKKSLTKEMQISVKNLNFEKAAELRDTLKSIDKVFYNQRVITTQNKSFDIVYLYKENNLNLIEFMEIRGGRLVFEKPYELIGEGNESEILISFISEFYSKKTTIQDTIFVNYNLKNEEELITFLKEKFKKNLKIKIPKSGFEKEVLKLAEENAKEHFQKIYYSKDKEIIKKVKELLNLTKIPEYIEGYDISNISGKHAVGSLVVFHNGKEKKEYYRKFKINLTFKPDDYGMLKEVFKRRFLHRNDKEFPWEPDLILIDGGKGQLNVALKVKKELNIPFKFIALAKEFETLFFEDFDKEINLPKDSEVLKLFQRIRDEAHRFAKTYYKKLHRKSITED